MTAAANALSVIFVCWGNICRSPMAERVAERHFADAGLAVTITSAGVSTEELGNPIDRRARAWLTRNGYRADQHQAHQITAAEIDAADLVVAAEDLHRQRMLRMKPQRTDHIVLLTDFVPGAEPGSGVPDPWYGDEAGFGDTLTTIEAAMPRLVEAVRQIAQSK